MCLIINSRYHEEKLISGRPLALKAKNDILVYKVLKRGRSNNTFQTPCRNKHVTFNKKGIAKLSAMFFKFEDNWTISKGIHAITKRGAIRCDLTNSLLEFCAIIPKGTKFFIGWCNDIVAKKLYIYKDKEICKKKHPNAKILNLKD